MNDFEFCAQCSRVLMDDESIYCCDCDQQCEPIPEKEFKKTLKKDIKKTVD